MGRTDHLKQPAAMRLFTHHIYEYRKGIRQLFMMTVAAQDAPVILDRLRSEAIDYHVQEVSARKVNVFFGRPACVETARRVVKLPLARMSPEEDFILGTLLGYDREQQCERFLAMAKATPAAGRPAA